MLEWCERTQTILQPYAPLRNLNRLSSRRAGEITRHLRSLSQKYQRDPYAVSLRLLVQSGLAVIPRASRVDHLKANLKVFDWEMLSEEVDELWRA